MIPVRSAENVFQYIVKDLGKYLDLSNKEKMERLTYVEEKFHILRELSPIIGLSEGDQFVYLVT